jgi:hypothetical protein
VCQYEERTEEKINKNMRIKELLTESKVANNPRLQRVMSLLRARHPQAETDLEALAFELLDGQRADRRDITRLDQENDQEESDIDRLERAVRELRKKHDLTEDLKKWFREKWVRFGPDGKIRGTCARGSESEGKPKCLPQKKAHALGKKGRASAAAKKRREDPNPERRGAAKNVATKTQEQALAEKQDACYHKVKSRYKVWPSAYASGALVQCRKKGAANWGNKSK